MVAFASNEPRVILWSPLLALADHTPIEWIYHEEDGRTRVELPEREARLFSGMRRLEIDDALYWMNGPLRYQDNEWQVPEADLQQTLIPLLSPDKRKTITEPFIVVLDPGHGAHDPGGVAATNIYEKDIVLDVAKRVRRRLIRAGVTVKLTRNKDVFVALEERPQLAGRWKASVFVSIHANKAHNPHVQGIESFVLPAAGFPGTSERVFPLDGTPLAGNAFDGENLLLADALHQSLLQSAGAVDRGIKRERFAVLRDAPCPAVLLEVGFLSNKQERALLQDDAHRTKLAEAIYRGIVSYREAHSAQQQQAAQAEAGERASGEEGS